MVQDKTPKGKPIFGVSDFIIFQTNFTNPEQQYLSHSFLKNRAKNSLRKLYDLLMNSALKICDTRVKLYGTVRSDSVRPAPINNLEIHDNMNSNNSN